MYCNDGDNKERSVAATVHAAEEDVEGETHQQWLVLCGRWTGNGAVRVQQWDCGGGWRYSSSTAKQFDEGSAIWGFQHLFLLIIRNIATLNVTTVANDTLFSFPIVL